MYVVEKEVRPARGWQALAVCSGCGYAHPFLRLPLLVVTGASGSGKSALALVLAGRDRQFVHLESDILWRNEFNSPADDYREYREMWLRLAKNISQAGKPVVLYGSVIPDHFNTCVERRYFSQVHSLALVCADDVLSARLRARPEWRSAGQVPFVQSMLKFNRWFREHASANLALLDTGRVSVEESAQAVLGWAESCWQPAQGAEVDNARP
jgi:predicted kinase